jgi:hypothetical protein
MGLISRLGAWVDRKFPEKVTVDKELHMAMINDIKVLALGIDSVNARIDAMVKKTELVDRKNFISNVDR